ncbi:MAG: hypothetical protein AAFU54_19075 [Chloroflexota bacterium]
MEKPTITITGITFESRPTFTSPHPVYVANIAYNQDDVSYALTVSGEGKTHPKALQDALNALNWAVALDAVFSDYEIKIIKAAHKLYVEGGASTWSMDTSIAALANVPIQASVETNPVRTLAGNGILRRYDGAVRTLFRLSDMGVYIIESHPQFKD